MSDAPSTDRNTVLLAATLLLAGCSGMTNEEIIVEHKKCDAAGMDSMTHRRLWDSRPVKVECAPRERK